ncbi:MULTISPECIES: peptidoglycan DD-metalloendopeptidase family protein [Psychrobacter]|uniref:peptidoglycan DD-metalloendopeptidase family protein n=1 Tax=Psychrobacter TaxID=497 RepID=UPI00146EB477|nr:MULTISPECIES: M23 family metallopeptidase [Psychrobacter]
MTSLPLSVRLTLTALLSLSALIMTGCATKPTYQLPSQSPTIITNAQGVPNFYQVKQGDTVSQIAARYNLNYRQVGALNRLDSQYTIYTGQMLKLWQSDQNTSASNNSPSYNNNSSNNNPVYTPPSNNTATDYDVVANTAIGYELPTKNPVIRNFDEAKDVKGMWFSGQLGDPVLASQAGVVLYAGDGLEEYGNLVMIRHSNNYITAYAHNSQILVAEGQSVQRGQRIATMGQSGQSGQVALEFQVRLNGNPIDPRAVLGR